MAANDRSQSRACGGIAESSPRTSAENLILYGKNSTVLLIKTIKRAL